ncbi:MAG: fatty acid metabolism transcriptional regulator FadR [Anaerolineae bacterium]|nr:fatty acid metabolism transcriptional regulator FadR [Anaerolineae bacterium]
MPEWNTPQKPADYAEESLITAILNGDYPPGTVLPGERDLAAQLGLTRPTLREALQRLARDGWVTIRQGKPTLVKDFWREGGLNVLSSLVRYRHVPNDFVPRLLEVRLAMAPAYTAAAVRHDPQSMLAHLQNAVALEEDASAFARYDWQLHHLLTVASGNPIYTLILNGFASFYEAMACQYFARSEARGFSRQFYTDLYTAFVNGDAANAEDITRRVMEKSIAHWQAVADLESR